MSATMQDETESTLPACSPVVCPDGCTSTTGHAEAGYVEDQTHTGSDHRVTLSREDLVDFGGTFEMEQVRCQAANEAGPGSSLCVHLAVGDDIGIKLAHGEALALRDALTLSAESIDPDRDSVQKSRGKALRDAREELDISIEDFASPMGESPADIRASEAGVYMTRQTAAVLARCLTRPLRQAARKSATA